MGRCLARPGGPGHISIGSRLALNRVLDMHRCKKKFAPSKFVFLLDRKKQVFCDSKKSLSETKFLFETVSNPFAASTRVGFWGRGAAQKNHKHRNGASCKLHDDDDDDKTVRQRTGGFLVQEEPLRMNFYICRFTARVWVKISGMKTQIILTLRPHIAFCWDERHCGLAWWWPWGNWRTERLRRRFRPRGTERGEKETHISLSLSRTHTSKHAPTNSLPLSPSWTQWEAHTLVHHHLQSAQFTPLRTYHFCICCPASAAEAAQDGPHGTCNVHGLWWCRSKIPHSALWPPATHMQTRCSFAPFCSHLFCPFCFAARVPSTLLRSLKAFQNR